MGEDSLLERVTAAAEERQLSHNSLLAYRRTWLKIIAWAAAEGLVLETFPVKRVGEFYEEATRGRSASHHLQVKAALALLSIARACPIERSTSFADPVVTLARAASDTPAGIQLSAAPVFIGAQIAGVVAGTLAFRWPTPD